MTKFRRIEINGFHRRVTIVSREWPRAIIRAELAEIDDSASRNDTDSCESVAPDSSEGQLILVEAVRFLERRFAAEARATICAGQNTLTPNGPNRNALYLKLQSVYQFICAKTPRFARKEN